MSDPEEERVRAEVERMLQPLREASAQARAEAGRFSPDPSSVWTEYFDLMGEHWAHEESLKQVLDSLAFSAWGRGDATVAVPVKVVRVMLEHFKARAAGKSTRKRGHQPTMWLERVFRDRAIERYREERSIHRAAGLRGDDLFKALANGTAVKMARLVVKMDDVRNLLLSEVTLRGYASRPGRFRRRHPFKPLK